MARTNWSRVILGGLLAGAVINAVEWGVHGVLLREEWTAAFAALGKQVPMRAWPLFIIPGNFLVGILAIWLYAGILRSCYGPGPKTASYAALTAWVVFLVIPIMAQVAIDIFPNWLQFTVIGVGLVDVTLGTLLGAWLYKEP
ncbi:MAG: hypothetical protein L0387_34555 [Acidobacteria bacterium]|nr:hypothetical protein [Acidobacteriota bacterium]